jgi:acyl-CoA reductase-like NAD-dependent aldehyde dehydrogenase
MERAPDIAAIVTQETGGTFGWGMFNCKLAAGMLDEAEAQTTAVTGEVIPSDVPGLTAIGLRRGHVPTALDLARQIESGIAHVNGSTVHDEPQMPFGGVKASGWGRFGGKTAIEEFTELRWITVRHGSRHYPL